MATAANRKRAKRIRGIVADANALRMSRDHLRLVLNGQRSSPKLLKRYRALKREQRAAISGMIRAAKFYQRKNSRA